VVARCGLGGTVGDAVGRVARRDEHVDHDDVDGERAADPPESTTLFGNGIAYEPVPIGFDDGSTFVDLYHDAWRALYKRDIPILRAMGVNTIRTYGFFGYPPTDGRDPSLPSSLSNTLNDNYTHCIDPSTGNPKTDQSDCTKYWDAAPWNHKELLDELWNGGTNPIYLLIGVDNESFGSFYPYDSNHPERGGNAQPTTKTNGYLGHKNYVNFYSNLIAWIGRNYGDHPSVLGLALFNEKNKGRWDFVPFWDLVNHYADQIHNDSHLNGKLLGLVLQTSSGDVTRYISKKSALNAHVDFWGGNQLVNNPTRYPFFNGFYYFGYADEWWKMNPPSVMPPRIPIICGSMTWEPRPSARALRPAGTGTRNGGGCSRCRGRATTPPISATIIRTTERRGSPARGITRRRRTI